MVGIRVSAPLVVHHKHSPQQGNELLSRPCNAHQDALQNAPHDNVLQSSGGGQCEKLHQILGCKCCSVCIMSGQVLQQLPCVLHLYCGDIQTRLVAGLLTTATNQSIRSP